MPLPVYFGSTLGRTKYSAACAVAGGRSLEHGEEGQAARILEGFQVYAYLEETSGGARKEIVTY